MSNAVFCIARSPAQATRTINVLLRGGFSVDAISALYRAGFLLEDALEKVGLVTQTLPRSTSTGIPPIWKSAGPLTTAFNGMTNASMGTLVQKLTELGVPHFEASLYAKKAYEAAFLLAIDTPDTVEAQRALAMLMDDAGAAYTCLVSNRVSKICAAHQSSETPVVAH